MSTVTCVITKYTSHLTAHTYVVANDTVKSKGKLFLVPSPFNLSDVVSL